MTQDEVTMYPGRLHGEVRMPASKSDSLRATMAAGLAANKTGETSLIRRVSQCTDQKALEVFLGQVGLVLGHAGSDLTVSGSQWVKQDRINCGESGFLARTLPIILAALGWESTVLGEGSLVERPIRETAQLLETLGGFASARAGRLPMHIRPAAFPPHRVELPRMESSQPISGLLMAAPLLQYAGQPGLEVSTTHPFPNSGYLAMTLRTLEAFGVHYEELSGHSLRLFSGSSYHGASYEVEGDWSAAAFWIVGALMGGDVRLLGLSPHSLQPDMAIAQIATWPGVTWAWHGEVLKVAGCLEALRPFEFDCRNCPDLIPPLAALGSVIEGISVIYGASKLASKESDRGAALAEGLGKLGAVVRVAGDELRVRGQRRLSGSANLWSHNDHRVAMALACASLACDGPNQLWGYAAVSKSYPEFWKEWIAGSRSSRP